MKSIAVDEATHSDVKKTAENYGLTIGDFIKFSVKYFKKTGINPASPDDDSPKKAIAENNKRLNEVIAFIRTQETTHLLPLLGKLEKTNLLIIDLINELNRVKPETPEITEEIVKKEVKQEQKKEVPEVKPETPEDKYPEIARKINTYKIYTRFTPDRYEELEKGIQILQNWLKKPDYITKNIEEANTNTLQFFEDAFYDMIIHGKITEAYGYKQFSEELGKRINLKIARSPEENFFSYKNRIIKILTK